jgi:hypothetical protein
MGGPGSGNWHRYPKKTAVENCRSLDANRWMREGILKASVWHSGKWCWFRDASRTEWTSAIGYEVCTVDPADPWLRLFYTFTETQLHMDYGVQLTTTRLRSGGLRWWFICPLTVNGIACGRSVGKLYLHGKYFGCRHCHDLTYTSCQESRKPNHLDRLLTQQADLDVADMVRLLRQRAAE